MTASTPSTPALTNQTNGNGTSSPTNGRQIASFEHGRASSGNGSSMNGNGKTKKNRKKKKKSKSKKSQADNSDTGGQEVVPDSTSVLHAGDKRSHDDPTTMTSSSSPNRPREKQRKRSISSPSQSPASLPQLLLSAFFFAAGAFVTMPLIFSTISYSGCGRAKVDFMVEKVLVKKSRGGEVSMVDWMRHLNRISSGSENIAVADDTQEHGKRKEGKGGSAVGSSGGEEAIMATTTSLHDSMCQVSSLAIGHFLYYLPYAQWLVLRNPFDNNFLDRSSLEAAREVELERKEEEEEESKRRGSIRKNPILRIVEGASLFLQHRKEKKMKRREEKKKRKQQKRQKGRLAEDEGEREVDWKKWKYAMSDDYDLSSEQIRMVKQLADRVTARSASMVACSDANATDCGEDEKEIASLSEGLPMPNQPLDKRLDAVSWGGINSDATKWWGRKDAKDQTKISAHSEGGRILAAYLKIMKWQGDMHPKYPFRLCAKGCDAEVSILHTLEWRQKFKPWCVSKSSMAFNKGGFAYSRGHARPGPKQRLEARKSNDLASLATRGQSMVWFRPGLASPSAQPDLYARTLINALESGVADSLRRNDGTVGRFNVVMDCAGMGSRNSPSIAQVKTFFSILQDHFPDRLGVLLAANLSGLAQMLMRMVLPFVTEDVRAKIHIVPSDPNQRREMLSQFMEEEEVPYYLGGKDAYEFDVHSYYRDACVLEEEGIVEYRTSMPYHA